MRNLISSNFFLVVFLSLFSCSIAFANRGIQVVPIKDKTGKQVGLYKESHALVIGISNYAKGWPNLPGVSKDIPLIKTALENNGFHVVVRQNLNRARLIQAYESFINLYGHNLDNRLLFYFAGHGHTLKLSYGGDIGYIIPKDTPNPNNDQNGFLSKAFDMKTIEVYAERIQAKHAIFIFDSSFSGSIFALSRSIPENISFKTAKPVRQFITSGSAHEQVPDKSIFRHLFIKALNGDGDTDKNGYLTGVELGEFLQTKVVNYSRGSQHPQYGKIRNPYLDKGDFVFTIPDKKDIKKSVDSIIKERKKIEQERLNLKQQRKRIEALQQLRKEKLKLKEERKKLEEEQKKLDVKNKINDEEEVSLNTKEIKYSNYMADVKQYIEKKMALS
jgi:hypothetical protein